MSRILVLGGTKFFGALLVNKLYNDGHQITLVSRAATLPPYLVGKVEHICEDITDSSKYPRINKLEQLSRVFSERDIDIVIDNISWQEDDIQITIQALINMKCGVKQYILCSSIAVYHAWNSQDEAIRELKENDADLWAKGYIPKIADLSFEPFYKIYAEGKRACEKELTEHARSAGINYTIIRPVVIEGSDDPHRRTWYWVQRLLDGKPVFIPDTKPATVYRHVYVEDVAEAFRLVVGNPSAYNETFNIAGEEILTPEDYIYKIANALGLNITSLNIIRVDPIQLAEKIAGFQFPPFFSGLALIPSIEKAKITLGFKPTPFDQWMKKTILWLLENKTNLPDSLGYNNRSEEVVKGIPKCQRRIYPTP